MTQDDRMETITDPAAIRACDEPDERGDFPCCTTPAPVGAGLDLDAIEARAKAATPGPWERRIGPREGYSLTEKTTYMRGCAIDNGQPLQVLIADSDRPGVDYLVPALTGDGPSAEANAEFIAHAREDVPALVAEVRYWQATAWARLEDFAAAEAEVVTLRARLAAVEALPPSWIASTAEGMGRKIDHWRGDDYAEGFDAGVESCADTLRAALATTGEGQ